MPHRHDAGAKPRKQGKRQRAAKAAEPARSRKEFYPHPLFGPIPMIPVTVTHADGTVARWFVQDGETRHALEALTAEVRALPVAELWNHEELVARRRDGWTPAQYESPVP